MMLAHGGDSPRAGYLRPFRGSKKPRSSRLRRRCTAFAIHFTWRPWAVFRAKKPLSRLTVSLHRCDEALYRRSPAFSQPKKVPAEAKNAAFRVERAA